MNTSADAERVTFQDGKRSISPLSDECICNLYLEPVLADTFGDFCQEPGRLFSAKNGSPRRSSSRLCGKEESCHGGTEGVRF